MSDLYTIVLDFVRKDLVRDESMSHVGPEDNLIDSGVIDSLGIQKLIAFIEADLHVSVEDEDLVPENFESVRSICLFLESKR